MPAKNLFACPECGLFYPVEALAKKCAAWCRVHPGTCDPGIIGQAVKKR
ncbi:MAG TPA: hypothetical protein HA252_00745 [Candidatus Diapherotrites archaeon]|uniref:Uncharacterized protein n=1 Tax=Candidatus Iainarchaeum sp. TaxID=3101447 RepID=A0A7J4JJ05_9ARCH|nr:hypothetical protein [Candidatus Diapherotrites archaeon]HIH15917.1 hypothetical protein [Candidatus Diapherotrites archaeon]